MIHDILTNAHLYDDKHPNFRSIFNILQAFNMQAMQNGHIELDGDYVFIKIKEIQGKAEGESELEAHRRYIDIQLPLTGNETFGYSDIESCKQPTSDFDSEKDIIFFHDKPDRYITVKPGEFIIFFPEDAHAPDITDDPNHRKMIVKVSVEPNQEKPTL